MTTKLVTVVGGEKGYVPVYDNSHGGTVIGTIVNGTETLWITSKPEEYGYVQISVPQFPSGTGERWIEKTHLVEVVLDPIPPVPEVGWKEINLKFENGRIYWKEARKNLLERSVEHEDICSNCNRLGFLWKEDSGGIQYSGISQGI